MVGKWGVWSETVPDFVYFDPNDESSVDSNGDSSADAEGSVWPEDGKGCASSVDDILAIQDDSSDDSSFIN